MPQANQEPGTDLANQLAAIQQRLDRIDELLQQQLLRKEPAVAARWRPSLRTLFATIALLAGGAAWIGAELRSSRLEAQAVATLTSYGAATQITPSESLLVALMPGSPAEPPAVLRRWLGQDFFSSLTQVGFDTRRFGASVELKQLREALKSTPHIRGLRLQHAALGTQDLEEVFQLSQLESLDLSHSQLDQGAIAGIADTSLRWFDGSHTWLGDRAAYDLSACEELSYLNMDRTALTDEGLEYLKNLKNLKHLLIRRTPVSLAAVQKFSDEMPDCFIQYQPLVFDAGGIQDPRASLRGSRKFGTFRRDPLALPPLGSQPGQPQLVFPQIQMQMWNGNMRVPQYLPR